TEVVTIVNKTKHSACTTGIGTYVVAEGYEGVKLRLTQVDSDVLVDCSGELGKVFVEEFLAAFLAEDLPDFSGTSVPITYSRHPNGVEVADVRKTLVPSQGCY